MCSDKLNICPEAPHNEAVHRDLQPLDTLLPDGYEYKLCKYSRLAENIHAVLRLKITTEDSARLWIKEFQEKTKTTLRCQWKYKASGQKTVFHEHLRCHHNTLPRTQTADLRPGSKNTSCPANLTVIVKRVITSRKSRSSDIHAGLYPMIVKLAYNHNHPVLSSDALKHRDVSEEVKNTFLKMYQANHSPSTALHAYRYDLSEDHGEEFVQVSADRALCPDLQWCYRLYYKEFKKNYGEPDGQEMLLHLEKIIAKYNTSEDRSANMARVGENLCIALCTKLMKRVHQYVRQSSEMVFVDSSGGVDRHGCRVFLLMTHSAAGGLPLGLLITSSESEKVLTEGFRLLKDLFPSNAFFGRQEGPKIFMTDDAEAERKALHNVFQDSSLLLCSFHILQAMWRFLWDAKHKVEKEHRPHILKLVKHMLYAKTEEEMNMHYDALCGDEKAKKYNCVMTYVEHLYQRRQVWAHCFRSNLPVRGNNTNNFCEAAMKVMKDKIFFRTKAFNVVQLVDFLFTRLENVYEQKLLDVANNRWKQAVTSRYISIANWNLPKNKITQLSPQEYKVPSQKDPDKSYHVNMEAAICSCEMGVTGGPCKHQHIVAKHFFMTSINVNPRQSPNIRRLFYKIATGKDGELHWFDSLHRPANEELTVGLSQELPELTSNAESIDKLEPNSASTCVVEPHLDMDLSANESRSNSSLKGEISQIENKVDEIHRILKLRVNSNPSMFLEPVESFLQNLNNMKTEASIVSALSTFGKYSGASLSRQNHSGKLIGVQPAAVARRKTALGGRRSLGCGRPVKSLQEKENMSCNRILHPIKRKEKAPHKLSLCVSKNTTLGKNHSSKS